MEESEFGRRFVDIKQRCAKLPDEAQERALDAFAQVLTLIELPREPGESTALSITLGRSLEVAYPSG